MILGWFVGGIGMAMGSLVGRVLVALGVTYVTYKGVTVVSDWLYGQMQASFGMMPAYIVDFLAWLWVDKAISMIFSAWTAALALKIGAGDSITTMGLKGQA
jgi:hypothetical protein